MGLRCLCCRMKFSTGIFSPVHGKARVIHDVGVIRLFFMLSRL